MLTLKFKTGLTFRILDRNLKFDAMSSFPRFLKFQIANSFRERRYAVIVTSFRNPIFQIIQSKELYTE